jgi:hypothetical protein
VPFTSLRFRFHTTDFSVTSFGGPSLFRPDASFSFAVWAERQAYGGEPSTFYRQLAEFDGFDIGLVKTSTETRIEWGFFNGPSYSVPCTWPVDGKRHLSFTYSGMVGNTYDDPGPGRAYLNGVDLGVPTQGSDRPGGAYIARRQVGGPVSSASGWYGRIDDVRVYQGYFLTAGDRADLFNFGDGRRFSLADRETLWLPLDEGTGGFTTDPLSGTTYAIPGNDGTSGVFWDEGLVLPPSPSATVEIVAPRRVVQANSPLNPDGVVEIVRRGLVQAEASASAVAAVEIVRRGLVRAEATTDTVGSIVVPPRFRQVQADGQNGPILAQVEIVRRRAVQAAGSTPAALPAVVPCKSAFRLRRRPVLRFQMVRCRGE